MRHYLLCQASAIACDTITSSVNSQSLRGLIFFVGPLPPLHFNSISFLLHRAHHAKLFGLSILGILCQDYLLCCALHSLPVLFIAPFCALSIIHLPWLRGFVGLFLVPSVASSSPFGQDFHCVPVARYITHSTRELVNSLIL